MDPETTTRDPRLARPFRPAPARTSSGNHHRLGRQQLSIPSPTDINNSNPDQLIRGVSDLVQAAVLAANSQSERERLQKRKDATTLLATKAKGFTSFPSTAAFFQKSLAEEDTELRRVDEALKRHAANYKQLENALRLTLASSICDSSKSENTAALQREVEGTRSDLSSANCEIVNLRDNNVTLEHKVKEIQDRVTRTESAFSDHASTLTRHARNNAETSERVAQLSSALDRKTGSSPMQDRIEKLVSSISGMGSQLEALQASNHRKTEEYWGLLENVRQDFANKLDSLSDQLTSYDPRLSSVESRLGEVSTSTKSLRSDSMVRSELDELKSQLKKLQGSSDFHSLTHRIEQLQVLQAMKDDLMMSEMEELKSNIEQSTKEIVTLKTENKQVSEALKTVLSRDNLDSKEQKQITALEATLHTAQQTLESVRVGLHSLEMRYNNLSTGPLVKSMAQVMQEMYPNAAQLIDRVKLLTSQFEQRLSQVNARLESLERTPGQSDNIQQSHNHLAQQVQNLLTRHDALAQSLMPLRDSNGRMSNTGISLNELKEVQSKVTELASTISTYIDSRKTQDDFLIEKMAEERVSLRSQTQTLTNELVNLSLQVTEIQENFKADIKRLKGCPAEIQTHQYRLRQLENVTATRWDDLEAKVKRLEESANQFLPSQGGSESASQSQLPAANTVALGREKKQPRILALSDHERGSQSCASSPVSFSSQVGLESTPNPESKKGLKKGPKKRKRQAEEPIVVE
ncbi:uncharacterized protein BP01DRAFT_352480 [Aspergillus saccharolyticus JOP 1030-1]|uniref:Paramyosin n=1 Tax=Aspergillus saccharolyticus JOP 1030-1 TaxID=1450539 RepID=A0A319A0I6_9EURO|nr:hypothetical protein BP01DRAFT_352480 [Aspergillus saccharolyticus JOP 1030-1]PYH49953.1 hypothetical protein BP01DRAFT_352480 [Aspergillus saccharolyticus JOP 1030-1]